MADSKAGTGKVQAKMGTSWKCSRPKRMGEKGHRSQLEASYVASKHLPSKHLAIFGNFEVEKPGRHHLNLVLKVNHPRKGTK